MDIYFMLVAKYSNSFSLTENAKIATVNNPFGCLKISATATMVI